MPLFLKQFSRKFFISAWIGQQHIILNKTENTYLHAECAYNNLCILCVREKKLVICIYCIYS